MNKFPENLGKPDIKISGLEIWIHGNQFPESDDYWDGTFYDAINIDEFVKNRIHQVLSVKFYVLG